MKLKNVKYFTVWVLPLVVIGGLFYPLLGYLVVGMMGFLLVLAFFKSRFWCGNICPRGAFLDIVMKKASPSKPTPNVFSKQWFKWVVFFSFMVFLVYRIIKTGGNWIAVASVFVSMCIITTVIAIVLAVIFRHRGWCSICPMGTLQSKIGSLKKGR